MRSFLRAILCSHRTDWRKGPLCNETQVSIIQSRSYSVTVRTWSDKRSFYPIVQFYRSRGCAAPRRRLRDRSAALISALYVLLIRRPTLYPRKSKLASSRASAHEEKNAKGKDSRESIEPRVESLRAIPRFPSPSRRGSGQSYRRERLINT